MTNRNKPRAGSMAFYPRVRADSIVPKFNTYGDVPKTIKGCKPLCFYAIKAGSTYVMAKNAKKGASTYGQEISVPVTIVETPDLKVVGARFYKHHSVNAGKKAIFEFTNQDSDFKKRVTGNKQKKTISYEDALKRKDEADSIVLIATVNYKATGIGQKKPVIVEVPLTGTYEEQLNYLKEKLNKTISIDEVFKVDDYLDAKGITTGYGTTGVVERFNIKVQRRKANKSQRHVGSINPWHPATIMFNIPRAGQYGFHNRTESNKRLLMIDSDISKVNRKGGFKNYGLLKNKFALVAGSLPGTTKRVIVLRQTIRPQRTKLEITDINYIAK